MNRRNFQHRFKGTPIKSKNIIVIVFLAFTFSLLSGSMQAQSLGVYEFNSLFGCNATGISSQPSNGTFSAFSSTGTSCALSSAYAFVRTGWNTSGTINTSEYHQFTLTPASGYEQTLTNLSFSHSVSWNNSTSWILRSSIDGYSTNIATGNTTSSTQTASVSLPSGSFSNVGAVTFRIYIVNCNSSLTSWTIDNVNLSGSIALICTIPSAPDTPTSNSPQCANNGVTITKSGSAPSGVTWYWQGTNASGTSTSQNATSTYNATTTGTYYIRAQNNTGLCWSASSASIAVTVNSLPAVGSTVSPSATVCTGTSVTLSGTGASSYTWTGGITDATAFLAATSTTYTVTGTDANGCVNTSTKTINVGQFTTVNAAGPDVALQSASPSAITLTGASVGGGATTGAWSIVSGGGTLSSTAQTSSPQNVTYTPAANYSGTVVLTLTTNAPICSASSANRIITIDPSTTQTFYSSSTFTVPSCIASLNVECWGAGGGGGANTQLTDGGGGGGGGAYSKSTITVTPGTAYTVNVGTGGSGGTSGNDGGNGGDSWFINTTTILAKGGSKGLKQTGFLGTSGAGGAGGQSSAGVGTLKYSGGNGANGNNGLFGAGGGGGSSAGTAANGNNASSGNGGNAPAGGGNGGDGAYLQWGGAGTVPGGGGAGSSINLAGNGGAGAAGKVLISWSSNLAITSNEQAAADVCAGTTNTAIHGFVLQGNNSCVTGLNFVTTGNYTTSELTNFKLYYTTTNTFSTSNLLATITSPATAGTQTFPAFSLSPVTGTDYYMWITMDVANTITTGHTIAVSSTSPSNITASMTATGSGNASGTQTLKPNAIIGLTSAVGTDNQTVCNSAVITNINYSVSGGGTGASVTGLPDGVNGVYVLGVVGISGTPSVTGTFNYTVNTTGTCTQTFATGTITVNPLPTVGSTVSPSATICAGTSVTLTGTGASSYSWTGGVTDGVAFVPTSTTTYTVTGTDGNACMSIATRTITVNSLPTVGSAVYPSATVCSGTNVTLNGTGASTYTWTGGITNETAFVPSSTSTYTVTGTDSNGCVNTSTKTITVNELPIVGATVSPSATVNIGTSVTLNGIGASSYSWTAGVENNTAFTPTVTATYTVTGTDVNSCSNTSTITITVNPLPPVGYTVSPSATVCAGTNVTLTGTGATTYFWSGGISDGLVFTPTGTATYTVTGTNESGFSNTAEVTVVVNPLPTITVSNPSPICNGGSTILTTSGAITYAWSPATGLSATIGNTVTAIPTTTTIYTVTGTDSNNCTNTNNITVTLNPNCTNLCLESD